MIGPATPGFLRRWRAGVLPGFRQAALVGCGIAIALGFGLGIMGGGPGRGAGTGAGGSGFWLSYSDAWSKVGRPPEIPGLKLPGALSLVYARDPGAAGLVVAALPRASGTALPPELLARLRRPPRPTLVSLEAGRALRYADLRVTGLKVPLTVYALPERNATILAACYATRAIDQRRCEALVWGIDIPEIRIASLVPDRRYARGVTAALGQLDAQRARESSGWQGHRSVAQAAVAARLAVAYRVAAGRLSRQGVPDPAAPANQRLVGALRSGQAAFAGLAAAARDESRAGYDRARLAVGSADRAAADALRDLAVIGYSA